MKGSNSGKAPVRSRRSQDSAGYPPEDHFPFYNLNLVVVLEDLGKIVNICEVLLSHDIIY